MLFDEAFAAAVRAAPDEVLADVPAPLRAQLAALDPRALKLDAQRRRRTLALLCEEWRVTTTLLALGGTRAAQLEAFFSSTPFHQSVAERGSMPLGFAGFLADELALGHMSGRLAAEALHLETALADTRRTPAEQSRATPDGAERIRRASGVLPLSAAAGAVAALAEVGGWLDAHKRCPPFDEPPPLQLSEATLDTTILSLVALKLDDGSTPLVTVDAPTLAMLRSVGEGRRRDDILAEAVRRGVPAADAPALLRSLIDDELLVLVA
jgi:hypothetical protein